MTDHHSFIISIPLSICGLLWLFVTTKHYSRHSVIPTEAWLLIFGITYGFFLKTFPTDHAPTFSLIPEVIIFIFLPILIYTSSRQLEFNSLKKVSIPIIFFSTIGVIFTAAIIGIPVALILNIPIIHGLVIGAAAGATDPAAVSAIFQSFKIPHRLALIIEGESLINDSTTVVTFSVISALALTATLFSLKTSFLLFLWAIFASLPVGIILGWASGKLLKHWQAFDDFCITSLSIILCFSAFILAEKGLHASGVIAVLVAAITFKNTLTASSTDTKEILKTSESFWDFISYTINGLIFFSLGAATGQHDFAEVPTIVVVSAIVCLLIGRALIIYSGCFALNFFTKKIPLNWQHILYLGGLRGAITAALILMLPDDYEYKGIFLCIAFAITTFTLIVQPTLLKFYLRRHGNNLLI